MTSSKQVLTDCTLCYHSCGTTVTIEDGKAVKVEGLPGHPINSDQLCPKGEAALTHVYSPNRIKTPLKKVDGQFVEISWDQALDEISAKLLKLKEEFGPSVLGVFSGSIGVENLEMAQLTQRFKAAFGSPNFFSVESICYRMRIRTRQITFGKYPTEELDSKLYILWGHNPDASDFPLKLALERNLAKGSKLVVIDPRRTPLADQADMYLKIRPGTDGAMAMAMLHVIVKEDLVDHEFVDKFTIGFDKLVPHVEPFTPEWAEEITWVPADKIRELARLFATTKGASIFQGTCTQDQTAGGTQNSRAFSVLQIITGNINVPGGWVISPRPHFGNVGLNVEGDPLGMDEYPLFIEVWGRKSPYGVITMVPEAIPDKLKAFYVVGGNPLVSMADSNAFREAFRRLDLLVVHDMFMTETAQEAHYVLPACSHLEKWGLAYTYNVCHCLPYLMLRKKCIEPIGESWSEWKVFTELAKRLGIGDKFPWQSEEELIQFELGPTGITFEQMLNDQPEGLYYGEKKYVVKDGIFATPSGKIEIYSDALAQVGANPLPEYIEPERSPKNSDAKYLKKYPLILSTGHRNYYYVHSQFRSIDELKAEAPHPVAEMGLKTGSTYGLASGDDILIETNRGSIKMKVALDERVAEGCIFVPHGWSGEANANLLTDTDCREKILGYPDVKSLMCSVRKLSAAA
ncbi:molybdopterin-containing oxidoreductase family protein [Geotalea toluenoxydans]|uniref:molybdopterin-containing oxidoreductase family protein n=1 Tax=Geotalea toluenoxydans TaxID=421624 RepID=UPI0006D1A432|nr:molybdopterin-dependent oxidoreductase [Geotalea toluenoxydans]